MTAFSTLTQLLPSQLANLDEMGYHTMTPIQAAALPVILQGTDVQAQAKTGSGKTAAFALGVLQNIEVLRYETQSLVLCPTRELAEQVSGELRRLARVTQNIKILTLCGGQASGGQREALQRAPHIVVGTPGRILDHLKRDTLHINTIKTLVLDEADRMLEMGFIEQIDAIISYAPTPRQTLLFSATWPPAIAQISQRIQHNPVMIAPDAQVELPDIDQRFYEVGAGERLPLLIGLLSQQQPASCIVFCNTKRECDDIAQALANSQISALALHGSLEQRDRDQVIIRFAQRSCRVLVATDLAARGLDIKSLSLVVNYQLSFDPEVHVHRIGRTARAGEQGIAVTFVTGDEMVRAQVLEDYLQQALNWQPAGTLKAAAPRSLPSEMMTICIEGGRKAKIRPGDIVGALTADGGLCAEQIGKITVTTTHAWVAVREDIAAKALTQLQQGQIKGKRCRARLLI